MIYRAIAQPESSLAYKYRQPDASDAQARVVIVDPAFNIIQINCSSSANHTHRRCLPWTSICFRSSKTLSMDSFNRGSDAHAAMNLRRTTIFNIHWASRSPANGRQWRSPVDQQPPPRRVQSKMIGQTEQQQHTSKRVRQWHDPLIDRFQCPSTSWSLKAYPSVGNDHSYHLNFHTIVGRYPKQTNATLSSLVKLHTLSENDFTIEYAPSVITKQTPEQQPIEPRQHFR